MSRATRPEAVRAGKKVLLIDGLQYHDDRPLRHLVLEGWKAEWPKRSGSIALGDVDPPDRWRLVAARLDALQEVRKIGLQALRILGRCHTIDTGSTILAGKPVGLPHPFQVEDVVQCGQSHPAFGSCKISYPLPFRGQVCKAQGPLPCCPSAVLSSRRPPSHDWVPASPVPQRHKHYEGATTPIHASRSLICFASGSHAKPPQFVLASQRSRAGGGPTSGQDPCSAGDPSYPAHSSCGREWVLSGSLAIHPLPLPRSTTPAGPTVPCQWRYRRCCPCSLNSKGSSVTSMSRLPRGFSTCCLRFMGDVATAHARLASDCGLAFAGRESHPLDRNERF